MFQYSLASPITNEISRYAKLTKMKIAQLPEGYFNNFQNIHLSERCKAANPILKTKYWLIKYHNLKDLT